MAKKSGGSKYQSKQQAKQAGKYVAPQQELAAQAQIQRENIKWFDFEKDCLVRMGNTMITVQAKAVGAFYLPPGGKYPYSAVHIIFLDSGIKTTVQAKFVDFMDA